LNQTPFYAESGGQVGDAGRMSGPGVSLVVTDVAKKADGLFVHTVRVETGELAVGAPLELVVDHARRARIRANHSATHLLHEALRQVLGTHVAQKGSLVAPDRLRFDFSHPKPIASDELEVIETIANEVVRQAAPVETRLMAVDDAIELGAMALFGEKYGDRVRVVDIGGAWSRELCAGTHVESSAEVGMINLVSESSVGSTNRRVESLVGIEAFRDFAAERTIVQQLTSGLKVPRLELVGRVNELFAQLKAAEKKIAKLEAARLGERLPELLKTAERIGAFTVLTGSLGAVGSADDVRGLVLQLRERLAAEAAVVVLAGVIAGESGDGKPVVIAATTPAAREAGAKAGALARMGAQILGGGGGGKDDLAQGGGADPTKIDAALAGIRASLAG
ncbi:MAG: alanine--tRNA ligase, partial [Leucobacter sp.]|nr:alanine--tRNA ligase [Leucobacter sp.]